ncbi:N-6 DNA methylase [Halobacillus sp. BAB-2008]|uniref:N-6 DNA methylase n=1 Tax=Halobacillus sp. BAB-2008 TaxID=1246484 RepID=UPI0002A4F527|nr:N-6 DNA methylase [Halobacillus sp. BAB-2008]ELK47883.1 N-6 DNA methylase [Halobacillus sp. BAB-2008]
MREINFQKAVLEGLDVLRNDPTINSNQTNGIQTMLSSLALIYIEELDQFDIPNEIKWNQVTQHGHEIGERLQEAAKETEQIIPFLDKALISANFDSLEESTLFKFAITLNKYKRPSPEEFGKIAEKLIYRYMESQGLKGGEHITPYSINSLLPKLLDIQQGSVYDGTAGSGLLLTEGLRYATGKGKVLSFYAQDINKNAWIIGRINLFVHGITNSQYQLGDTLLDPAYKEDHSLKKFDYVMMNFPFSISWNREAVEDELMGRFMYGLPSKSNADMAFISHAIASLNNEGKAALVVSHGVLFRGGAEGKIRKELIQSDLIEGVIGLPSNLFSSMGIPVAIVLINKNKRKDRKEKIFFMDASEEFQKGRGSNQLRPEDIQKIVEVFHNGKEIQAYSRFVKLSEIEEGSLSIRKYFDVDDVDSPIGTVTVNSKSFMNHNVPKKDLGDVAEVYRGINMPSKSKQQEPGTEYKVIQLTDVQGGEIQFDTLQTMTIKDSKKAQQYMVRKGDIIVSARGTTIKVAVVPDIEEEIILSHNFIGLRLSPNYHAQFLKAYLESPLGQYYLSSSQKGSAVKVISLKEIVEVPVPELPYDKQQHIGNSFVQANKDYQQAIKEAERKQREFYLDLYEEMEITVAFEQKLPE